MNKWRSFYVRRWNKEKADSKIIGFGGIISMISALTGCNEPEEQENGVALVYGQYNQK